MKKAVTFFLAVLLFLSTAAFVPPSSAEAPPALKDDSTLVLSLDGTYVFGTNGAVSASSLASQFEGDVKIIAPDGSEVTGASGVPSWSTACAGGASLHVLVSGDASRDGKISLTDVTSMLKKIAAWDTFIDESAADVTGDGRVNLSDVTAILKYIAGWRITLGNVKITVDESAQTASAEDASMKLWFEHANAKLWREDTEPTDESTGLTYVIRAAKNEAEDCALYIKADKDCTLIPQITEFKNCYGETVDTEILTYYYVSMIKSGADKASYGPDALLPNTVDPAKVKRPKEAPVFQVKAGESQGYIIKATTTADTRAGLYEAVVSIKDGASEVKRAKVYLDVWNFTLSDADAPGSSFGMGKYKTAAQYAVKAGDRDGIEAIYKKNYDYFLDHRINLCLLPYEFDDERCDEYLNSDRVKNFIIAGYGYGDEYAKTDEQIREIYAKLSKNPEWFEKGYFYYCDEPHLKKNPDCPLAPFDAIITAHEKIESLYPGGKQIVPLGAHNKAGTIMPDNLFEYLDYCQIWCPIVWDFTDPGYLDTDEAFVFADREWLERNGTYADAIQKRLADPNSNTESWWYFAGGPWDPYVSFHAEDDGLSPRTSFWQQMQYRVDGVLYYCVDDYRVGSPYRDIDYKTFMGGHAYGNGILVYPGYPLGISEPVGSLRVEYIRDGIEDFMYLRMIERAFGEDVMDEYISRISTDLLHYNESPDVLIKIRNEIGDVLEKHLSDSK